jgi:hypothetical protein
MEQLWNYINSGKPKDSRKDVICPSAALSTTIFNMESYDSRLMISCPVCSVAKNSYTITELHCCVMILSKIFKLFYFLILVCLMIIEYSLNGSECHIRLKAVGLLNVTGSLKGWYRTRGPKHCDHFVIYCASASEF